MLNYNLHETPQPPPVSQKVLSHYLLVSAIPLHWPGQSSPVVRPVLPNAPRRRLRVGAAGLCLFQTRMFRVSRQRPAVVFVLFTV